MKQPTILFATLVTGLILVCVLTGLAVSLQESDLCRNSMSENGPSSVDACDAAASHTLATSSQPTPTLAPPRPEISLQTGPLSNELAKGQPVFLKVETDQNEIEVDWATP